MSNKDHCLNSMSSFHLKINLLLSKFVIYFWERCCLKFKRNSPVWVNKFHVDWKKIFPSTIRNLFHFDIKKLFWENLKKYYQRILKTVTVVKIHYLAILDGKRSIAWLSWRDGRIHGWQKRKRGGEGCLK